MYFADAENLENDRTEEIGLATPPPPPPPPPPQARIILVIPEKVVHFKFYDELGFPRLPHMTSCLSAHVK